MVQKYGDKKVKWITSEHEILLFKTNAKLIHKICLNNIYTILQLNCKQVRSNALKENSIFQTNLSKVCIKCVYFQHRIKLFRSMCALQNDNGNSNGRAPIS